MQCLQRFYSIYDRDKYQRRLLGWYLVYWLFEKVFQSTLCHLSGGRSGGVVVLGKLPVLRRPSNLDNSGASAYCACSRCGRGLFGHFFSHLSLLFSLSLSPGDSPM